MLRGVASTETNCQALFLTKREFLLILPGDATRGCRSLTAGERIPSLGGFPYYWTQNAGVAKLTWNQPSPTSPANCALFDPYHVASKAV